MGQYVYTSICTKERYFANASTPAGNLKLFKQVAIALCGVMFLGILFSVPETRFFRQEDNELAAGQGRSNHHGVEEVVEKLEVMHSSKIGRVKSRTSLPKKTYLRQLSLWSGIAPGTNLFELCIRPFPLVLYPAVLWASVICAFTFLYKTCRPLTRF